MQAFELCESLNAVGAVLDLHKLLDNRKALPEAESKMAVLEALGEISRTTGPFYLQVLRRPPRHSIAAFFFHKLAALLTERVEKYVSAWAGGLIYLFRLQPMQNETAYICM